MSLTEVHAPTVRRARARGDRRTIIHGDACEPGVLDLVGLQTVDTVVAATGDGEDNLVISLLCRRLWSCPGPLRGSTTPKNTWLLTRDWGVDTAVSAPELSPTCSTSGWVSGTWSRCCAPSTAGSRWWR